MTSTEERPKGDSSYAHYFSELTQLYPSRELTSLLEGIRFIEEEFKGEPKIRNGKLMQILVDMGSLFRKNPSALKKFSRIAEPLKQSLKDQGDTLGSRLQARTSRPSSTRS